MDIKIEAPGHPNQNHVINFYQERLEAKYGVYPFIHSLDVKVVKVEDGYKVSLQLKPERGTMIYAEDVEEKESAALEKVIKKMNKQIERYKKKHYQSANRKEIDISDD